jgi:Protein of unknown function (DUF2490)
MKLKFLLIFLLFCTSTLFAQKKEVTKQSFYWIRYYNQLKINEKLIWHNEFDNRTFFEHNRHHQFIINSILHNKLSKNLDAAYGLTYSLQNPQDPNAESKLTIPEVRPLQEINYSTSLNKKLMLQQRFRIEERFVHKNNGKVLLDGYDFNFRFRCRVQFNLKISKQSALKQTTLKLSEEVMVNAGKAIVYNYFDQNRSYIAFEQELNKSFSVELGYLKSFHQRSTGYQFYNRDTLRFTLHHKIKL